MKYVQTSIAIVGPFDSQTDATAFASTHGGELIDPILDANAGTWVVPPRKYGDKLVAVVRQTDGSWTVHPQPPLPAISTFLADGGWRAIAQLRADYVAVEWFPLTADYLLFCEQFGPPPETWSDQA